MDEDYSSSPDPISILADSSPVRRRERSSAVKSRQLHVTTSPTKSIVLDGPRAVGRSPYKIRVTLQTETESHIDRNLARRAPERRRGGTKRDESNIGATIPVFCGSNNNAATMTTQLEPDKQARRRPTPRRRSRRTEVSTQEPQQERSSGMPRDDAVRNDRSFSPSPSTACGQRSAEHPGSAGEYCVTGTTGETPDCPGERTTFESEEFSMISVDSLSSKVSKSDRRVSDNPARTALDRRRSLFDMPSSPPMRHHSERNAALETPQPPRAPLQKVANSYHLLTPSRESAMRSGKVLQDIVRSPDQVPRDQDNSTSTGGLFAGFSADTRRKLRQSLQLGAALAESGSALEGVPSRNISRIGTAGAGYPDLDVPRSQHRLPTPDERENSQSSSALSSGPAVYPGIPGDMDHSVFDQNPASSASVKSYDMMSWMSTGLARGPSANTQTPVSAIRETEYRKPCPTAEEPMLLSSDDDDGDDDDDDDDDQSDVDGSQASDESTNCGINPSVVNDSYQLYQQGPSPSTKHPPEMNDAEIWQEAASEPLENAENDEISSLCEASNVPRRSKIPGTWRRASGNHFHYSDSPEPEMIPGLRQASNTSSDSNRTGVATPPSTADEFEEGYEDESEAHDSFQDDNEASAKHAAVCDPSNVADDAVSPDSEVLSADGDDTGVFWQSNLPNVFQGRPRGRDVTELSAFSELKPISSPAKPCVVVSDHESKDHEKQTTQARPALGNVHSKQDASNVLSSPLRKSLLKSSKIPTSPAKTASKHGPATNSASPGSASHVRVNDGGALEYQSAHHGEQTEQQSDTAQFSSLHDDQEANISADSSARRDEEDIERQTVYDTTYLGSSRSYVENLNLDSPTKIAVKFNDTSNLSSVAASRPTLSPEKKRYHSLFDEDAPLGESIHSESSLAAPVVEAAEPRSLVSRMTNSFWSVITSKSPAPPLVQRDDSSQHEAGRSTPSPSPIPEPGDRSDISAATNLTTPSPPKPPPELATTPTATTTTTTHSSPPLPADPILALRRKYGLLSDQHPFTMAHARTLHRLHASLQQHPTTTLVPATVTATTTVTNTTTTVTTTTDTDADTLLPLRSLLGQPYTSSTSSRATLTWTEAHLRVVAAFLALLTSDAERERLEKADGGGGGGGSGGSGGVGWGDEVARKARGWDARGRHGTWFAFAGEGRGDKAARALRGTIRPEFVLGVLGETVLKEERRGAVWSR